MEANDTYNKNAIAVYNSFGVDLGLCLYKVWTYT